MFCICLGIGELFALIASCVVAVLIPVLYLVGFLLSCLHKSWGAPVTRLAHYLLNGVRHYVGRGWDFALARIGHNH